MIGCFLSASASLKINVTNIRVGKGSIFLEIFNSKAPFFKKPIVSKSVVASESTIEINFDLPEGEYAIAAYQDLNNNKILDRGLFGMPKEPFAFSNNFRPLWSEPTFDDCKFIISKQSIITLKLK